jgi:hypothetical protein
MKKQIFFLVLLALPIVALAQERRLNLEMNTTIANLIYNISFEQVFPQSEKHSFGYRVSLGTANRLNHQFLTLEGVYYFGKTHQLELAPGFVVGTNSFSIRIATIDVEPFTFRRAGPFLRIGYVYNTPGRWIFKAGFSPSYILEPASSLSTLNRFQYLTPYLGIGLRF